MEVVQSTLAPLMLSVEEQPVLASARRSPRLVLPLVLRRQRVMAVGGAWEQLLPLSMSQSRGYSKLAVFILLCSSSRRCGVHIYT